MATQIAIPWTGLYGQSNALSYFDSDSMAVMDNTWFIIGDLKFMLRQRNFQKPMQDMMPSHLKCMGHLGIVAGTLRHLFL